MRAEMTSYPIWMSHIQVEKKTCFQKCCTTGIIFALSTPRAAIPCTRVKYSSMYKGAGLGRRIRPLLNLPHTLLTRDLLYLSCLPRSTYTMHNWGKYRVVSLDLFLKLHTHTLCTKASPVLNAFLYFYTNSIASHQTTDAAVLFFPVLRFLYTLRALPSATFPGRGHRRGRRCLRRTSPSCPTW